MFVKKKKKKQFSSTFYHVENMFIYNYTYLLFIFIYISILILVNIRIESEKTSYCGKRCSRRSSRQCKYGRNCTGVKRNEI